jgi:hypothetical protein
LSVDARAATDAFVASIAAPPAPPARKAPVRIRKAP